MILHVARTPRAARPMARLGALVAVAAGLVLAGPASPASAAPGLGVSPAQGLSAAGQIVVVTGGGYKPNIQLFVMQCRAASAQDHTCNSVGLQKVTTDGAGAFSTRIKVIGNFGATDCLRTACAVKTSAVSGHADDRSQDVSAGIGFAAAPPVTQPPATQPPATQPPVTQPPATQPPVTQPPAAGAAGTTTTVAGATTTTKPGATTTTADDPTTTTAAETDEAAAGDDEGGDDGAAPTSGDEEAAAAPVSNTRDDDGGSGSGPIVAVVVVLLVAAGGGTALFLRQRGAKATAT